MMNDGFIKLYRKFFDHHFWKEDREFSRAEAWIDLLRTARYKKGTSGKIVNGRLIEWERGELLASVRFLQDRWGWGSTGKVTRFLEMLEKQNMVRRKTEQGVTVLTICNYSTYNPMENDNGTGTERRQNSDRTETEQWQGQNSKKVKKVKKGKKEKSVGSTGPSEALKIARFLKESIVANDPDHRYAHNPPTLTSTGWEVEIDRAMRLDGRTPEQLRFIIEYVHNHSSKVANFWKPNIQSGKTLRDHFDRIKQQIINERNNDKKFKKQQTIESELDKFD